MNPNFTIGARVQFHDGQQGTIAAIDRGFSYRFQSDTGALFTVRHDEVTAVGTKPPKAPPALHYGEWRTVAKLDGRGRQATPSQQQQAKAGPLQFDRAAPAGTWQCIPMPDGGGTLPLRQLATHIIVGQMGVDVAYIARNPGSAKTRGILTAAQDLHAALLRVTNQLAHEHPNDEAWQEARAALAKAEA